VITLLSSEARNEIAFSTSSGFPILPMVIDPKTPHEPDERAQCSGVGGNVEDCVIRGAFREAGI
jgi:hypothetical protein